MEFHKVKLCCQNGSKLAGSSHLGGSLRVFRTSPVFRGNTKNKYRQTPQLVKLHDSFVSDSSVCALETERYSPGSRYCEHSSGVD